MTELLAVDKRLRSFRVYELRERIVRMLERIRRERDQRFHFSCDVHPCAHPGAPASATSFRGETNLHGVEKWQLRGLRQKTVPGVDPVHNVSQFATQVRSRRSEERRVGKACRAR